jgi:hypothetical protein
MIYASTCAGQDLPTFTPQPARTDSESVAPTPDRLHFFRKDMCAYIGIGLNTGGDFSTDYRASLTTQGVTNGGIGVFVTFQGGYDFAVADGLFLGPKVRVQYSSLPTDKRDFFASTVTETYLIYTYGVSLKYYPVAFRSSALYVTGSYSFFSTSYTDVQFAFEPDGQELYGGLGYEFTLGGRHYGVELGYSHIPLLVGNWTSQTSLSQKRNFGGIEINLVGTWEIGMY